MHDDGGRRASFAHQRSYSCGDISPTDTDRDDADSVVGDDQPQIASTSPATGDDHTDDRRRRRRVTSREILVMDSVAANGKLYQHVGGNAKLIDSLIIAKL